MDSNAVVNRGGGGSSADVWSRGTKRGASDSNLAGDFERFEKRLRMLTIRGSEQKSNGRNNFYTPVSNAPATTTPDGPSHHAKHVATAPHDGMMQVDDTRDRVFVRDLDAELAELEEDADEKLIFLPDIEKRLSRIPRQVLSGGGDGGHDSQELVLYGAPKSLSMEAGHDSVRKAIMEARQRAREKAAEEARQEDMARKYDHGGYFPIGETAHGYSTGYEQEQEQSDPDAMDIG
ncbi:hypothetical protein LTR37_004570 [Vermiconidia calcicola]|uniref:Uncharacterized protein n=1 Tax=Vermiconidia calcicola TaxID=1690605 RepID=A0ACC3NMA5_9PEZI|nr:hypothetical protein LTR37_004570 [Vermiconidia calcicola]